jgi:hypothetical protein
MSYQLPLALASGGNQIKETGFSRIPEEAFLMALA